MLLKLSIATFLAFAAVNCSEVYDYDEQFKTLSEGCGFPLASNLNAFLRPGSLIEIKGRFSTHKDEKFTIKLLDGHPNSTHTQTILAATFELAPKSKDAGKVTLSQHLLNCFVSEHKYGIMIMDVQDAEKKSQLEKFEFDRHELYTYTLKIRVEKDSFIVLVDDQLVGSISNKVDLSLIDVIQTDGLFYPNYFYIDGTDVCACHEKH